MTTIEQDGVGSTERLFSLLDTKYRILLELKNLAIQQSDVVGKQDVQELMTLLARKQVLMERLMGLQASFSPFTFDDPEQRTWSSPERRKECQQIKSQCDAIVHELLVMEERSIGQMSSQRDLVASQLLQVTDALRLSRAYASDGEGGLDDGNSVSFTG